MRSGRIERKGNDFIHHRGSSGGGPAHATLTKATYATFRDAPFVVNYNTGLIVVHIMAWSFRLFAFVPLGLITLISHLIYLLPLLSFLLFGILLRCLLNDIEKILLWKLQRYEIRYAQFRAQQSNFMRNSILRLYVGEETISPKLSKKSKLEGLWKNLCQQNFQTSAQVYVYITLCQSKKLPKGHLEDIK